MKGLAGKITRKISWWWRDAASTRFPDLNQCAGEVRVLCFHGVCPDDVPYINGRLMHATAFHKMLSYLKDHAHVLSAAEWQGKAWRSDRLNILLTFDDGYLNNAQLALPILEELNLPSLWFITGQEDYLHMDLFDIATAAQLDLQPLAAYFGIASDNERALKRKLIMASAAQVHGAMDMLIELTAPVRAQYAVFWQLLKDTDLARLRTHELLAFGNHTRAHFCLTEQTPETVDVEVEFVHQRMLHAGMASTDFLAVPYGIVNKPLIDHLQKRKKWCIFVNDVSPDIKEFTFERLTVNPFISLKNQVYAIYHGYY